MVLVLVMGLRIMCCKYIKLLFLQILCRSKCYRDRKKMKIEMQRKLSASACKRRQKEKQNKLLVLGNFHRLKERNKRSMVVVTKRNMVRIHLNSEK